MIYRAALSGNDHNLTAPTDAPFASAPYNLVGRFSPGGMPGTPIGPRLVCTARHVGITPGTQFTVQGVTVNVQEVIHAPSGADVDLCVTDAAFPSYALMYRGEAWSAANWVFMVGGGLGRGAGIYDGETLIGYNIGDFSTFAWRWGGAHPAFVTLTPAPGTTPNMGCLYDEGSPQSCYMTPGDSGGGVFINTGPSGAWRFMGPAVSASGNQARFSTPSAPWYGVIGALLTYDLAFIDNLNASPPDPVPAPEEPPPPPLEYPSPPSRPYPEPLPPARGDLVSFPSFPGDELPDELAITAGTIAVDVADGCLNISGGSGAFDTNRIECVNCYTADENWTMEVEITSPHPQPELPSAAYIGLQSQATGTGISSSVWGGIGFSAAANGHLILCAPSSARTVASATGALGLIGAGNQIRLTLTRARGIVTLTALNRTTNRSGMVSYRYAELANSLTTGAPIIYPPSTGRPAIASGGGSWAVKSLRFTSNTTKFPPIAVIGDDIACGLTQGLAGIGTRMRWSDTLQDTFGVPVPVFAGGGDTASMAQLRLPEIISIQPQVAVIGFGLNDVTRVGATTSQVIANIQALITTLETYQIKCKVLTGLPPLGELRASMTVAFPDKCIDTYPLFLSSTGGMHPAVSTDGIHPNQAGHEVLGRLIAGNLK